MSDVPPPTIIKRKKVIEAGGHHGGAWKVAYADFVTAMMAFFMLMWLLNATTENQRKGLADYFAPSIPISRMSGGGDGMMQGDSTFAENILARNGQGATAQSLTAETVAMGMVGHADARSLEDALFEQVVEGILGQGGDSLIKELALDHIQTRLTDEGLVIEIFALRNRPLFEDEQPTEITRVLATFIADAVRLVTNGVTVEGHVPTSPIVVAEQRVWERSLGRAQTLKQLLIENGVLPNRFQRLTGHGDRTTRVAPALDIRNSRIEIILLRSDL